MAPSLGLSGVTVFVNAHACVTSSLHARRLVTISINITPTILRKEIEDARESRATLVSAAVFVVMISGVISARHGESAQTTQRPSTPRPAWRKQ
jgi:hypothetical protein